MTTRTQSEQFTDRFAVVTGATQGLGEAVARLFAERGAAGLVLTGRDAGRGERVAADLVARGCQAHFEPADLADVAQCRRVVARADAEFGALHALVNCAGLMTDAIVDFDQSVLGAYDASPQPAAAMDG